MTTGELLAGTGGELVGVEHGEVVDVEHLHPQPRQYVMIAVVLVVITAIEVAMSYATGLDQPGDDRGAARARGVKFFIVVAWYMHLRPTRTSSGAGSSPGSFLPSSCS